MLHEGVSPDRIAFLGVPSVCSHAGLVNTGLHYFNSVRKDYQIKPTSELHACLVDLIVKAGHPDEAYDVLASIPFEPDANVLGAFVGACKVHGNARMAEWAAKRLLSLAPNKSVNYAPFSSLYGAEGCWEDVLSTRRMRHMCGNKEPGCSWIEIGGTNHTLVSHDRSQLQA
ncbi:unnamed protein product [Musa hybrid cultivar]